MRVVQLMLKILLFYLSVISAQETSCTDDEFLLKDLNWVTNELPSGTCITHADGRVNCICSSGFKLSKREDGSEFCENENECLTKGHFVSFDKKVHNITDVSLYRTFVWKFPHRTVRFDFGL